LHTKIICIVHFSGGQGLIGNECRMVSLAIVVESSITEPWICNVAGRIVFDSQEFEELINEQKYYNLDFLLKISFTRMAIALTIGINTAFAWEFEIT
jgi:hypothetical protein